MKYALILALPLFLNASVVAALTDLAPGATRVVRAGDAWSSATFLKREGHKYDVRYADGTDEWVTIDRLRIPGAPLADAPASSAGGAAISLAGPFTQVNLQPPAEGIAHRASVSIRLKPTTRPSAAFTDLTPAAGTDLGNPENLIVCADTPAIVVAVGEQRRDDTTLLLIHTENPSATEQRTFTAHNQRVIAAADGGATILSQPTDSSLMLHLWQYVDGQYQLRTNFTFVAAGKNKRPDWATLLSPTRMLIRCDFGDHYLIDLPTHRQVACLKCDNLQVHCSGQFLLAQKDQAAVLLRPYDLAIIAQLSDHASGLSVDATATYAAVENGDDVTIIKLGTNAPTGRAVGPIARGRLDLLGAGDLLVEGRTYYDLKTGIPVWSYNTEGLQSTMLANGQMLYVGSINGQTAVCMGQLPDASAASALTSVSADSFLMSPGTHIAIAGDLSCFGNAATARANIEHALANAGQKADDAASQYKLTFSSAAGPTGKFSVRQLYMGSGPLIKTVDSPSTIVTAVLTKDAKEIWKQEMKFSAGPMIMVQHGETLEQAVANAGVPNAGRLNYLGVPRYIVKGAEAGKVVALGESDLTRTGFVSSPSRSP
jgi:hypothetical protein